MWAGFTNLTREWVFGIYRLRCSPDREALTGKDQRCRIVTSLSLQPCNGLMRP
jgi:hypothetical protein